MAEDDGLIRRLMAKLLGAQGHRVLEAEDGQAALDLFRSERPDIVVSDIRMPGMDGICLMQEIRALDPEAEVILVTGYADTELVIDALRKGASNFLAKPFHLDTLLAQIEPSLLRLGLRRENARLREALEVEWRIREEEGRHVAMARLLAGLAREIRIPLDLAAERADLLRQLLRQGVGEGDLIGASVAEAGRLAEDFGRCANRINSMVTDVERFLCPEKGSGAQAVPLAEAVDQALAALEAERPKHVAVTVALPEPDLTVHCDPCDLAGCLTHVIRNSYEALALGGTALHISAEVTFLPMGTIDGFTELVVEDDGPGVPQEIIEEVFAPFFSTREGHSGLGLLLALEACRRNGGQLEISLPEAAGTRVTVRLPLAARQDDGISPERESSSRQSRAFPRDPMEEPAPVPPLSRRGTSGRSRGEYRRQG